MGDKTNIEWTEATWTPIRARAWDIQNDGSGKERIGWHCEHVSEGCRNCYAERMNDRLGTGRPFKPGELRGKPGYAGGEKGRPELFLDERMLTQPLRWKRTRQIFVCSMTDLFATFVPDEWIDRIFAVMALCPQHTFQVLTKRPERMREYLSDVSSGGPGLGVIERIALTKEAQSTIIPNALRASWPLPNVWLGVSVEDQRCADQRIPHLLETPAAIRWVSYEPALGPVKFTPWLHDDGCRDTPSGGSCSCDFEEVRLDWIVAGGESGPNARPTHPDWFRQTRDQCAAAGVPFLFKQWGEWCPPTGVDRVGCGVTEANGSGAPDVAWPDGTIAFGRADQHGGEGYFLHRVGKTRAGRLLDGVLHDAYPEPRP